MAAPTGTVRLVVVADKLAYQPAPAPVSLSNLILGMHDYATGGNPWTTAGTPGEQKTYRGTYVFDTTGLTQVQVDALQGGSVTMDFVWELQNS